MLYLSSATPRSITTVDAILKEPRITQDKAIKIAEDDLKKHVGSDNYKGIILIIVNRTSGYVPFDKFHSQNLTIPLVYVHHNGSLTDIDRNNKGNTKNLGQCNDGLTAYCSFLPPFNFDYRGRLVYGVEVVASYDDINGIPFLYILDANSGEIVDSTFLRDEKLDEGSR